MMKKRRGSKNKGLLLQKRYLKLLSVQQPPKLTQQLIKAAPEPVLKLISNAAIHAALGKVRIPTKIKNRFKKKKSLFKVLTNKGIAIEDKRKILTQKGGAAIIPALLSLIIPAIGNHIYSLLHG